MQLVVLRLEPGQVGDRGARARQLGRLLLVLRLQFGDVLAALRERPGHEVREEVHAERPSGEKERQQELLHPRTLEVEIGHGA